MRNIHLLLTLSSLNVLLVIIERVSFTTKILLDPFHFLRLHEFLQIATLILFTVLIPFGLLYVVTNKFEDLRKKSGLLLGFVFITGVYFYATGNGVHELASFFYNTYCPKYLGGSIQCGGMFFNDYYYGNILYFIGAVLMNVPILLFEKGRPQRKMSRRDLVLLIANSLVYALAIFAYAAFDLVLVGVVYSVIFMLIADGLLVSIRKQWRKYPLITYSALAYTAGTIASLVIRFL